MAKLKDIYSESSPEDLAAVGFQPDTEAPETVVALQKKLEEMDSRGEGFLDLQAPEEIVAVPEPESREQAEAKERMKSVAGNMIACLDFNPEKESFLVITDTQVIEKNPALVEALRAQLAELTSKNQRTKGNFEFFVVPTARKSAEPLGQYLDAKLKNRPTVILASRSRSHSSGVRRGLGTEIDPLENYAAILRSPKLKKAKDKGFSQISLKLLEAAADNKDGFPKASYESLRNYLAKGRSRVISVTKGHNPFEILTRGAVEESPAVLSERGKKVSELMREVEEIEITSELGTNLRLKPRTDKTEIEDGKIDHPGAMSNYPIGEWSCSPFLEGASGTLVVDGPIGGGHNLDLVKRAGPLKYELKDGEITSINDFDLAELKALLEKETDYDLLATTDAEKNKERKAERLRIQTVVEQYLKEKNFDNELAVSIIKYLAEGDNLGHHCFRIAEFAVGTNGKACEGKPDEWVGSSEGEKMYRSQGTTAHLAFGNNGVFGVERDDPNFNDSEIHCDNVIGLQSNLNIRCRRKDGQEFNLIEDGKPIGY